MELEQYRAMGEMVELGDDDVFVVDVPAATTESGPPLLVIHGFPTSSIDWAPVIPSLSADRRLILFDLPGFGLSAKPDRTYSIFSAADAVERLVQHLALAEFDLVTHDMGDTVGGEVLARQMGGELRVAGEIVQIGRRVVTNGSIYLAMAQLTDGQRALWSAPDEMLPADAAPTIELMEMALAATFAPPDQAVSRPDPVELSATAEAVCLADGARLLPRLIRYLSDREAHEDRFTGAIESHPSPLGVVWGALDPIAVAEMAQHLAERRGDTTVVMLDGVGHYPMLEAPGPFARAVREMIAR